MDAKKCDRCGNFYCVDYKNNMPNRISTYKLNRYHEGVDANAHDICPECMKSFERWLRNEQTFT